jgi:hypothetical protein
LLPVPCCAYPRIDYIAPCQLNADSQTVYAFRVDYTKQVILSGVNRVETTEKVTRIPCTPTGEISAQSKTSLTFGLLTLPPWMPAIYHISHPLVVRLYRPGFQLVEVTSENKGQPIRWQAAPDRESQAQVLESLFPGAYPLSDTGDKVANGSQSPAHREALLFGASEYERLAAQANGSEKDIYRSRAKWLHDLAEE